VIEKSGTWFSCKKERMGQGREAAKLYLKESAQLSADVEKEVKEKVAQLKPGQQKKEG
jgi:recombination protein RecA